MVTVHTGFDMVPPLSKGDADYINWANFLLEVQVHYKDDQELVTHPHYLQFLNRQQAKLPFEAHKFLRFSFTLQTDADREALEFFRKASEYVLDLRDIAEKHFDKRRIHYFHEGLDIPTANKGTQQWKDVIKSIISYEQVGFLVVFIFLEGSTNLSHVAR